MPFIFKPIILYIIGVVLLRISGTRSIAQMTVSQTILIISLGHILVEPFADKGMIKTITVAIIFTILLMSFELIEYYFKGFEKLFVGKEKVIIKNGVIVEDNMKKLKLTDAELYSKLRQEGISKIEDIDKATIESNGELGYELNKSAQPITVKDMEYIVNKILRKNNSSSEYINLVEELKKNE